VFLNLVGTSSSVSQTWADGRQTPRADVEELDRVFEREP
jgi:hypothetical protein